MLHQTHRQQARISRFRFWIHQCPLMDARLLIPRLQACLKEKRNRDPPTRLRISNIWTNTSSKPTRTQNFNQKDYSYSRFYCHDCISYQDDKTICIVFDAKSDHTNHKIYFVRISCYALCCIWYQRLTTTNETDANRYVSLYLLNDLKVFFFVYNFISWSRHLFYLRLYNVHYDCFIAGRREVLQRRWEGNSDGMGSERRPERFAKWSLTISRTDSCIRLMVLIERHYDCTYDIQDHLLGLHLHSYVEMSSERNN